MESGAIQHHPAFREHVPEPVLAPEEYDVEFPGLKTRRHFVAREVAATGSHAPRVVTPPYPSFDEEYFEWIDLLESIDHASGEYVIVELGAGYGRWCMRAATLARRRGLRFQCVAVEAEPDHFRWLRQHFRDNDVNPSEHDLIWAAVAADPGVVPFRIGNASAWYGQRVASPPPGPPPSRSERRRLRARSVLGRPSAASPESVQVIWVPSITLGELLAGYPRIDLLDIDIQGAELEVLSSAVEHLDERVRRIHIGTHRHELETGLRELFTAHGWINVHDYGCQQRASTPYGDIHFVDGVQTWVNPDVGRSPSRTRVRMVERLRARIRALESERDQLRARCRALEEKMRQLNGRRRSALAVVSTWLRRRAGR